MVGASSEVKLNASALFNPNSLIVYLSSKSVPNSSDTPFKCLIDSGSTHSFIESTYVPSHSILTHSIPLISLKLFNGSTNSVITKSVEILIQFPSGHTHLVEFYVMSLDSSVSVVLRHNWIT